MTPIKEAVEKAIKMQQDEEDFVLCMRHKVCPKCAHIPLNSHYIGDGRYRYNCSSCGFKFPS